jgi:hypothetical protein
MPITGEGGTGGLPANWQNLPTTEQSLEEAVGLVDQKYGADLGAQFEAWYRQAWARAPRITPTQATIGWVAAADLGSGITATGVLVGQVPGAAAAGAENVANSPLGKATNAAWTAATAVPRFLSMLTSGNLWLRVGEVVAGLILLGIGVNALFKGRPMSAVTGTAGKLAPLAMA